MAVTASTGPSGSATLAGMMNLKSSLKCLFAAGGTALLAGCITLPPSVPADPALLRQGITLERALPSTLPDKAAPIPHAQLVLLPTESAAGFLMPIPFVAEAIEGAVNQTAANAYESKWAQIHPFRVALAELQASPLYRATGGAVTVKPFAFVQACADDRYRVALVLHATAGDWTGRYMAHLPSTYSADETARPGPAMVARLSEELKIAAGQLRTVLERAAQGELQTAARKADVGSLQFVCGRSIGLISPNLMVVRGAEVIEESAETVLVRMPGDVSHAAALGGLYFGVHLLRKDQLHTFKPVSSK